MDTADRPIAPDSTSPTRSELPAPADHDNSPTRVLPDPGARRGRGQVDSVWPSVRGYEVLSVIGSGGMGVVYKARHRELRRTVALKTIRTAALADPELLQRFHAEAEAVARLHHPHIIQVYEIGSVEPQPGSTLPGPFIALEFVDGDSLARRTADPQPPAYAARIVEKLARAAHAAHRLGIIHRDLKPSNVLLTRDGEPKIADFGLAKLLVEEHDAAGRFVTRAGTIMGTPEYMPPEQAAGATPTPAVDIYALGAILYELLTARVPLPATTPMEMVDRLQRKDPVSPRRLRPGLPRDLETICLKCLEKKPERRYGSAEALADDLRRYLDGRPILARPVGPLDRAARWARRNPLPAVLTAAVVLVGLVGLAGIVWEWREAVAHAAAAESARAAAELATSEAREHTRAERWERYRADIIGAASALQVSNVAGARRTLEAAPREHRGWEWQHFHSRLDLAQNVLPVLEGRAYDAAISADGRRVLLFADGDVRVWDAVDRREVLSFQKPGPFVYIHLSPDGKTLAYCTSEREVVLRDVDTNQVRAVLRDHDRPVGFLTFIQNGERLIAGSKDQAIRVWGVRTGKLVGLIDGETPPTQSAFSASGRRRTSLAAGETVMRIWDMESGRQLATLPDHKPGLQLIVFNEGGDRLLTAETYPSNRMRLWEPDTGRLLGVMRGHSDTVTHAAFSPDGRCLASSSMDQTIRLWSAADGRLIATLRGHRGGVKELSFSPDSKRLASASEDQTVRLWDATTGEAMAVLHGHTGTVRRVAYTADGATIVSAAHDGTIRTWDARLAESNGILRGHTEFVYSVAFHPDGEHVASAAWDGTVRLWDATTGRQTALLSHGEGVFVTSVAFHPDGKLLATRARDAVRLWDVATGREVHRWEVPGDAWRDTRVAFNRRGDRVAAGCAGRVVRIWDVGSRAEVAALHGHLDEVRDVAFSPDGRWLASVGDLNDPVVRIWDVARGEQVRALEGHTNCGYALAFNGDGTLLASGAIDGTVRLWDTSTWEEAAVLKHGTNVYGVAFTPDGTRLACACADNTIRLWDVQTRQEVAELRGHCNYVHQVAFSPDGTRLASASGDHSVRIWDTLPAQERQRHRKGEGGRSK